MLLKKWQFALLLVAILFVVLGIAGAGWALRPVVDYYMEGAPESIDFDYGHLGISVKYRNRGETDILLFLVITTENAHISVVNVEPWIIYNQTQVKFRVAAQSRMQKYGGYYVEILPVGNPQNFTITYTIEDRSPSTTVNGIISRLFLEPRGYYPTHLFYNRTETNTYELVK